MPFSEAVTIAICFNNETDAKALSEKLKDMGPKINFIASASFEEFVKAISKTEKIDCFIIEEDFKEFSSIKFLEQIKNSKKYKQSVRAMFTNDLDELSSEHLALDNHYNFDRDTNIKDIVANLKQNIIRTKSPVIPRDYNVLVLDNSSEILEVISMHLQDLGHGKFDLCHSIQEAEEKLIQNDFDLLLLDWNLDDGTCIDLIEFIKSESLSERTKSALTMVITGRNDVDDIMTLLSYGVKDHIIKPFEFREFEEKISYALEKHVKR